MQLLQKEIWYQLDKHSVELIRASLWEYLRQERNLR